MGCTTSIQNNKGETESRLSASLEVTQNKNGVQTQYHGHHSSRLRKSIKVSPTNNASNDSYVTPRGHSGRHSPAISDVTDRTETNKSIKRVAFNDELDTCSSSRSPTELKKARQRRERNLRKKLLNQMGEAEVLSERLLVESERLSLTSSMSRATSRTGSSFPYNYHRNHDTDAADNITETTAASVTTPRNNTGGVSE